MEPYSIELCDRVLAACDDASGTSEPEWTVLPDRVTPRCPPRVR